MSAVYVICYDIRHVSQNFECESKAHGLILTCRVSVVVISTQCNYRTNGLISQPRHWCFLIFFLILVNAIFRFKYGAFYHGFKKVHEVFKLFWLGFFISTNLLFSTSNSNGLTKIKETISYA